MVDALGKMLLDGGGAEIVERDDGFIAASTLSYFAPVRRWPAVERRGLRFVRGRVLDVGVGAGRVALELQRRERDVVAIDVSPGAVQVACGRGVRDVRLLALEDVDASLGHFDTMVMYGNNFGLFGSPAKAHVRSHLPPLGSSRVSFVRTTEETGAREMWLGTSLGQLDGRGLVAK